MWTKFVGLAVLPLNLFLELTVLALLLRRLGRRRLGAWLFAVAFVGLWMASTPMVSKALLRSLEGQHDPLARDAVPVAHAIVCLGGGIGPANPPRLTPELSQGADRVLYTSRLYRAGKAPLVIVAGGGGANRGGVAESHDIGDLLVEWGVPREAILEEADSVDTYENAVGTKRVMEARKIKGKVLLVTSAVHMPRALAVFRAVGIEAVPCPTDFISGVDWSYGFQSFLPDSGALQRTTDVIHEYVGFLWYRLKGRA